MQELLEILQEAEQYVSADFRECNRKLFVQEHLKKLSGKLVVFLQQGPPAVHPPPYFSKECTPPLKEAYVFFEECMRQREQGSLSQPSEIFAKALERAGITNILILMGLRITPGSYCDHRAIPPLRVTLCAAAEAIFSGGLSAAGREWTKHTQRSGDAFWGTITGNDAYKNKKAMEFIQRILNEATWWNVFGHFRHGTVFEARLPSGHGARWGNDGTTFIGFLEPFLE